MLSTRDSLWNHRQKQVGRKGWKQLFQANSNQNKTEVSMLILRQNTLKVFTRDKEGHCIMIKG